jgi:carbon storage regulator CsrA
MLVLSRKINESIIIGGNIRITATAIRGRQVRLCIDAPPAVRIVREELLSAATVVESEQHRMPDPPRRARRDGSHSSRRARLGP